MKFRMISEEDVKAIRAAKKVLNRLTKKVKQQLNHSNAARKNPKKDYKSVELSCWRTLDEMDALGITVLNGSKLSLRILPSIPEEIAL